VFRLQQRLLQGMNKTNKEQHNKFICLKYAVKGPPKKRLSTLVIACCYILGAHTISTIKNNKKLRNRGYYTVARRFEFYFRVVKTIFYERAQRAVE